MEIWGMGVWVYGGMEIWGMGVWVHGPVIVLEYVEMDVRM